MKYKTKYQVLVDRYQDGLKDISSSTEAWKNFLESAAYTYVQPFRNEVVLHQRAPHIKAAATYNDWQKLNRYVLGGKHGIPVFDPRRAGQVTYVFDFKDTAAYRNLNAILPWTVYSDKSGSALHNMLKRGNARTLNSYIHARVSEVVTEGAKQSAPPELTRCLEQSVRYVLHIRLDLPTGGLDVSDFAFVTRFSTQPAAVEKLGHLLHESMKACLHPLRSVAYSMHMTMPAPEEIAVQAKQQEPSAAPAAEAAPPLPDLTKVPVRLDGDTITIGHGEATHEIDVTVSDEDHAAMVELAKAKRPVKHRPLQAAPDVRYEQLSLDEAPAQNAAKDYGFEYQLLDRLRTDCDYFLGAGSRSEKHLWAGSVRGQIAKMRELYDRLPEKPEWLTLDDINKYAQRMAPQYQVVVYHHSENGLDERREYQTLAAAEHAAQKYLDGTMDGENGFAYEGAGVYDLQARRLVKTLGNFPAEQAVGIDNLEDIKDGLEKELQQDKATQEIVPGAEANAVFPDSAADHAVEIPIDGEWKKFQTVKEAEHAAYQEWIKEGRKNAVNYISTGDAIPSGGPKARFQDNIAALRLLQHLDATGQQALPDQQRGLARYVGWGGLADAFDGTNADWAEEYKTLKELLPAQEYEAARASTLTSFYTPPEIIRPIYETLARFTKDAAAYSASYHEDADGQEVFAATIQGVPYTKRTDADAALIEACKAAIHGDTVIGQYCGFDIHAYYNPSRSAFSGYLQGAGKYEFDYLGKQNFQQLQRILKSLPDGIEAVNSSKDTVLKDIESAKEAVRQPFTYEAEFQTKLARLNELNILLDQEQSGKEQNMNNPETYQQYLEHRARTDSADRLPPDVEDAARQAGLTVQRDQDKPGAAYFDAGQNVIHVSDAGSEADVRLSELKGYADAVIQRTATVEPPIRDLESASLAVMLAARYDIGVSDRLSQQLASAHAEAVKCPAFDLPVILQRLDKAMDYCDHFLAHEQERELVQEAENAQEPEQMQELSPQSQAFMMDM